MENIEQNKDIVPKQEDLWKQQDNRLDFLNDEKFSDIKEPLTKTINDLADEHIVIPEEDFRNNIEQVTKEIFFNPLYDFDIEQKTTDAQNIFLFRTKFEEIKKENIKNIKEEQTDQKKEQKNTKIKKDTEKEEQTDQKKEQKNTKIKKDTEKEEQTDQKKEQTDQKKEQTDQKKEQKETLYTQLMTTYETIEETYKPTWKENLSEKYSEITQKSEFQTLSEKEQENYLKARYTAEKIVKEARKNNSISEKHVAFIEQFNELDKELNLNSQIDISGIPRENIETKSSVNTMNDIITNDKIGEELVARNESIQSFVKESKDIIPDKDKEQLFPIETVKTKVIERYPDKIEETLDKLLTNNNLTQYKENFNPDGTLKNTENIDGKDKKNLEKISDKMNDEITDLTEEEQDRMMIETNEVIKTKAVEALIKNIGQYFQITSFQRGNLAEQFDIDVENGIKFDKDMLKLSGNMDGRDIGFYYDMENGKVRADDFIHFDGQSETKEDGVFFINRDQDRKWRERLPIKMKTLDQILADSKSTIMENIENSLENSNEPQEYRKKLSENTQISYQQKSSVGNIVIEHTMEKNTAVQEFHEFVTKYIPTRNSYGRQKEQYEYNIYKTIDTSFDRYTADEIKQRNRLFQRFQNKINEKNPSFEDPLIRSLFNETTANKQKEGNYDQEKGPNIYQFLQGITNENGNVIKEQVIDLTLFEDIVNELEMEDGNTKKLKGKSKKYEKLRNDFEEEKTKDTADKDLRLEDNDLRGNST